MDNLLCAIGTSFHKENTVAPVIQRRLPFRRMVATCFGMTPKSGYFQSEYGGYFQSEYGGYFRPD
jgi:hypothetical protein